MTNPVVRPRIPRRFCVPSKPGPQGLAAGSRRARAFRHLSFGILSSFGFRHSTFRPSLCASIPLKTATNRFRASAIGPAVETFMVFLAKLLDAGGGFTRQEEGAAA